MTSGGARSAPVYGSGRSERRGVKFVHLPVGGFEGKVPAFPLMEPSPREADVWLELWRTPQAFQWFREQWRVPTVGLYVRWMVRAEDPRAPATVMAQVSRLADQLGLTSAGLRQNGWVLESESGLRGVLSGAGDSAARVSSLERARERAEQQGGTSPRRRLRASADVARDTDPSPPG